MLVAFTIVVLGGMGSFVGAPLGGFIIGIVEALGGLLLGEQLGPDRHLADLHPDPAAAAHRPVREQGSEPAAPCSASAGFAAAVVFPLVAPNYLVNVGMMVFFVAFIGQSWNLAGGFAGQTSFGHVVFFGTGAYTSTILQADLRLEPVAGLAGRHALAGAIVGWVIAVLSFRAGLRGSYFALITLAFAEVFRILANSVPFTRGGLGMLIEADPAADQLPVQGPDLVLLPRRWRFASSRDADRLAADAQPLRRPPGAPSARTRMRARALGIDVFAEKVKVLSLLGRHVRAGGTVLCPEVSLSSIPPSPSASTSRSRCCWSAWWAAPAPSSDR